MNYNNEIYLTIQQRILELLNVPEYEFIDNLDNDNIYTNIIDNTNASTIRVVNIMNDYPNDETHVENNTSSAIIELNETDLSNMLNDIELVSDDDPDISITTQLSYAKYIEDNVILQKYKIPELKHIAKSHKLRIGGTKKVLIDRIKNYFIHYGNTIKIQKIFRGHLVRKSFILRGPALRKRKLCVNETDGFTLEPLDEIAFELFYSYTDNKDFVYGFDLLSLITLYKNKGKIVNPYTREKLSVNTLCEILTLGRLIKILFPNSLDEDTKYIIESTYNRNIQSRRTGGISIVSPPQSQTTDVVATITTIPDDYPHTTTRHRNPFNIDNFNERQREIFLKLEETRRLSMNQRIQDLFIEIDILGNYTQSYWFSNLDKRDLMRLFRFIYDFWNYRGQLNDQTKRSICYLYCPFTNVRMINRSTYDNLTEEQARESCLAVMEHLIYCGVDIEYQKLGALHVLSGLTMVSMHARNNLYWLYESLIY